MDNESKRKSIHIFNGLWAFILPFLPRIYAIIIVFLALIFVFILARPYSPFGSLFQRAFKMMARKVDWDKGYLVGPSIYVMMILVLVIFVDYRIAGALFAILAFGDGFATIFGRKFGKHQLYNSKSLEGSMAFFGFSLISSYLVFLLINTFNKPDAGLTIISNLILPKDLNFNLLTLFVIFIIITFILTLVELFISDYFDDNLVIPIFGCIMLYIFLDGLLVFQVYV